MILGVGVDILLSPRLERLVARRGWTALERRILHPDESKTYQGLSAPHKLRFLAVRWAVKEAAFKAVQPLRTPTWKQFSFLPPPGTRKPILKYHGTILSPFSLHASVSHDGDYVIAYVVAEGASTSDSASALPKT